MSDDETNRVDELPAELRKRIEALEERLAALENPPCCEGGPQWGHAWSCPKCPD
jgi:hypothetical protein